MPYRLFIDESGTHSLNETATLNSRYLSLTGIILDRAYLAAAFNPALQALKQRHFAHANQHPIILHRKELVNRDPPFDVLRDPARELEFNTDLLRFVAEHPYVALTVTIDKQEHFNKYQVWRMDPYHYCLQILMERYVLWLRRRNGTGDIMCEARNRSLDKKLKKVYRHFYAHGSDFISAQNFQQRLTSRQLKLKGKSANISALQLVDLLAHPCRATHIARHDNQDPPQNFGGQLAAIMEASKYDRPIRYGRKWLP